ncbi:MAG: TetR/AcrR family transcriptional regulator [Microthrixaceae bacterium]
MPAGPDAVRRAVLDAAASLFARDGVALVTLRDIADAAQVNLGLINRYLGTREDLIRAVFEDLTEQLLVDIRDDPTGQRGFEPDSVMGRWTRVLTYLVVVDPDLAVELGAAPLHELTAVVVRSYGQDEDAARLRVAQLLASALGWRVFEPYLLAAAGIDDEPLDDVRLELTRTHRRLAATPLPSPDDPPFGADLT